MVIEYEVLILHELASGILAWLHHVSSPSSISLYPPQLLRSFNRLLGYQIQQQLPVTPSVVHLLDQVRSPLINLLGSTLATLEPGLEEDVLLIGHEPTQTCLDWAISSQNPVDEVLERGVMQQVLDHCRSRQRSDLYRAFRRFVIEHPVLDSGTLVDAKCGELADLAAELNAMYESAPGGLSQDGRVAQCGHCGQLLEPGRSTPRRSKPGRSTPRRSHHAPVWHCRSPECWADPKPLRIAATWSVQDCCRLRSPFHRFIYRPGLAELAIAQDLQAHSRAHSKITVELWPDCDRYDLRVTFTDGTVWEADVKDWRSPAALGRHLAEVEPVGLPPHDRFWIVIPQQRIAERPSYLSTLQRSWRRARGNQSDDPGSHPDLHPEPQDCANAAWGQVTGDRDWIQAVENYTRQIAGHPSSSGSR